MKCNSCQAEIPENGKFCTECGTTMALEVACSHCGEKNPTKSTFCAGCGQVLKDTTGASQSPIQGQDFGGDFIYLLSEETLRAISNTSVRLPYGCFAITLVDGVVKGIQDQVASNSQQNSIVGDFFKAVSEFARGLIGQKQHEVRTYIVTNCQDLPLISYVHPIEYSGLTNASLRFDFWLAASAKPSDAMSQSLGIFFQRVMGAKTSLSLREFRQYAINAAKSLLVGKTDLNPKTQESLDALIALMQKTTGITGHCSLAQGKAVERRYLEVSKVQDDVTCKECFSVYAEKVRFCESCGANMELANWTAALKILQSASADTIVLKISVLSESVDVNDNRYVSDESIARAAIDAIGSHISKTQNEELKTASTLDLLSRELNTVLKISFKGILTDFSVIDIKLADQDWFLKTEALIKEELRKIDAQQRGLSVDERALDFSEAAFALAMRSSRQQESQRREQLELRAQSADTEINEHALETRTELRKEDIDNKVEAERFERQKDKVKREFGFQRDIAQEHRIDDKQQLDHEMQLEKKVAGHDIDLADLTGDAQSRAKRRDIGDKSFETEEQIRLRAHEKEKLGNIEEDLQDRQQKRQSDKLKSMAEIEANMAKQDQDFELNKVESMKTMDAAAILAMQAAQLVKTGGGAAAAEIVKSIAQSQADASGAAIKDDMYKQLVQAKDEGAHLALDAQKAAMDALIKSNENITKLAGITSSNATEGYKEAAKIAQTTNEKSMESMSKVATAAAGRKPTKEETEPSNSVACVNAECDQVFVGKAKKFCPKCGSTQFE